MALISSGTIIRSLSLFHITLAFLFLTSPKMVSDQTIVFILGEAMKLPAARSFETTSAPLSFLAAILAFLGISDLVSISMPEEVSLYHWGSQAPIRFAFTFFLSAYSFVFSSASPYMRSRGSYEKSTWGEGFKNRMFFTWAFIEMITWFWVYLTLREERSVMAQKQELRRRQREELDTL